MDKKKCFFCASYIVKGKDNYGEFETIYRCPACKRLNTILCFDGNDK